MFDYNKMIQRAITFFPTWSDIRKRYKTSTGGRLLSSVVEELVDVEDAIKEYKKFYFLDTYEGHEDDVMAFSYRFPVGNVEMDTIQVTYKDNSFVLTDKVDKFVAYNPVAYFEGGYVYTNDRMDPDAVRIFVNDMELSNEYSKISIWNIFDEFACFVGIERHDGELNSQLVKRILHTTRHKPNSSIEGLQNAIISELMTEFPDITKEEIKIETVNGENLRQAYKDFNTLLDYLNSINCDVYRWKRWDLNVWQHDFKSISYIPAVWDESVERFTNGVGYGDDCEVMMASNTKATDAIITLYDKSKETMNKYLADKNIEKNINIKFQRYNDILNTNYVNYTIKASPLTQLEPEQIQLDIYQETHDVRDIPITQVYKHGHNIEVNNSNSVIKDMSAYRLKFEPKDNSNEICISKCKVYYINKITGELIYEQNLLKEKTGFVINSLGNLVSNSIKRSITKVEDFDNNQSNYFVNIPNGGGIKATGTISTGSKTLYNLGGQKVSYSTTCELSDIINGSGFVSFDSSDCRWEGNNVIYHSENKLKKVHVKLTANQFTFDVLSNNTLDVMVRYSKEGQYVSIEKATRGTTWSTEKFEAPRYMEIVISTRANEEVKIGNFKYCNYEVNLYTKTKTDFVKMTSSVLPVSNTVTLKVEVVSRSGGSPIIKGIYIGTAISNTTYITDSFSLKIEDDRYLTNCEREIDIVSNCKVTKIKRDFYDTTDVEFVEDYDPAVSYKAVETDAYIRLNLDEYSHINSVTSDIGQIQKIEESGKIFYNLALTTGQEARYIRVDGVKNEMAYSASLLDMIRKKMSGYNINITTDKVYCSRLVKGVVVIKNGEQGAAEIVKLDSSLFYGISSAKYVFSKIPSNIGVIWGTGESYYSDSTTGSFDYISFYNENDKIHVANNSYNLFINEIKNIPIAENFTEPEFYNRNKLNFYTVESNTDNMGVRFYNYLDESKSFDSLSDWSVGIKNLYLKNTHDYNNNTIYDINSLDYSNKEVLAEYINIQDSYTITSNNIINTEQYIVIPPAGMTVEYKEYDGTSSTEHLVKTEAITIDETMFKKLKYSNIDRILYMGASSTYEGNSDDMNYTLLNTEGIIVWNTALDIGSIVYIKYTIKKPVALVFDLDTLYKLTGYTVDTYRELNSYHLLNMNDGDTYDLNNFSDFPDSDLAYIQCSEPSFEGQMLDEHTVRFNKHIEEKTILVKTGYYYFNGREYYLFSEDESKTLYNNKHISYDNVDVSDDYIYTYKATNNYVRNSEMLLRNINDLYRYDCGTPIDSPKFNKYTACDSYNDWYTFNTDLTITDIIYKERIKTGATDLEGFNDAALQLTKKDKLTTNYAYIDITEYVKPRTFITLAATKDLQIFIGEENKLGNLNLRTSLSISPIKELKGTKDRAAVRTTSFSTKKNTKYYVIVIGEGVIDDIIISEELSLISNYHVKNIEKLGFSFSEPRIQGAEYRMKLNGNYRNISNGASVCSDGYIRPVGNVTWNATKIKTYDTMADFNDRNCYKDTQLIIDEYVKAPATSTGRFVTDYVTINPKVINRLIVKVNDVLIDNMNKFKIKILSTDDKKRPDVEILSTNGNFAVAYGDNLYRFVKFEIEIPEDFIIDKIEVIAEYKSDKENAPVLSTPNSGHLISPVYDSQQSSIYSIKNIKINDISNINDIEIYIRAMTDNNASGIWTEWCKLPLVYKKDKLVYDNNNKLSFKDTKVRFFQFKVELKSKDAYIDLNSIDIEVIE